jgi:hypothetical protein
MICIKELKYYKLIRCEQEKIKCCHEYISKVVMENEFGFLKHKWKLITHFNSKVHRKTLISITYCVLHKYCMKKEIILNHDYHIKVVEMAILFDLV